MSLFSTTYKYTLNPEAGTIKLSATKGQIIFAVASMVLPWVVLWVIGSTIEDNEQPLIVIPEDDNRPLSSVKE